MKEQADIKLCFMRLLPQGVVFFCMFYVPRQEKAWKENHLGGSGRDKCPVVTQCIKPIPFYVQINRFLFSDSHQLCYKLMSDQKPSWMDLV